MKIQLNISNAEYTQLCKDGLTSSAANSLFAKLENIPVLKNLIYFQEYGKRIYRNNAISTEIAKIIKRRKGIIIFYDENSSDPLYKLTSSAFKNYFNWVLELKIEDDNKSIHYAVQTFISTFSEFYRITQSCFDFGLVTSIKLPDIEHLPFKSTKFWRFYDKYALVDIINLDALSSEFPDMIKITELLTTGSLPKGVNRINAGNNIYIIDWSPLIERNDYQKLLSLRVQWYEENSDFILDSSHNSYGDSIFVTGNLIRNSYFTFVDNFTGNAFKGVVFSDDSQKMTAILKEIINYKTSAFNEIYLIVSNRSDAIKILKEYLNLGFSGVLYTDNEGQFWMPNEQ